MDQTTNEGAAVIVHNCNATKGYPMFLNKAEVRGTGEFRIQFNTDQEVKEKEQITLGSKIYEIKSVEITREAKGVWGDSPIPNFFSLICGDITPKPKENPK